MPAIEVHELCKRYGDRVAVDAISFTVADGEVVARWFRWQRAKG
jgi:ABC-type multidrug transport system ATPase subunit